MTTTAEVREALAVAASACGLPVNAYETDIPVTGSGYVTRGEFDPRYVFGQAKVNYPFRLVFFFARTSTTSSLQQIDELCDIAGSGSLLAAVQDGTNWPADLVDYAQVVRVGEVNVAQAQSGEYLTVDFDIEVVW